jgi:hypothetical protein
MRRFDSGTESHRHDRDVVLLVRAEVARFSRQTP